MLHYDDIEPYLSTGDVIVLHGTTDIVAGVVIVCSRGALLWTSPRCLLRIDALPVSKQDCRATLRQLTVSTQEYATHVANNFVHVFTHICNVNRRNVLSAMEHVSSVYCAMGLLTVDTNDGTISPCDVDDLCSYDTVDDCFPLVRDAVLGPPLDFIFTTTSNSKHDDLL